jgi:hypothetical protein
MKIPEFLAEVLVDPRVSGYGQRRLLGVPLVPLGRKKKPYK